MTIMPERAMTLETNPVPTLVYEPHTHEHFRRVAIKVPIPLFGKQAEQDFHDIVNDAIWDSCGSVACRGADVLTTIINQSNDSRSVLGGTIYCNKDGCPLDDDDDGGSHDREPRRPYPIKPPLQVEASYEH